MHVHVCSMLCLCAYVYVHVRSCVRACVRVCMRVSVCVCCLCVCTFMHFNGTHAGPDLVSSSLHGEHFATSDMYIGMTWFCVCIMKS